MRFQKQIEASRTTGAKSKGPISRPGTRDANRGVLAAHVVPDSESGSRFESLPAPARSSSVLHHCESSGDRQFSRALSRFVRLRAARPATEEEEIHPKPGN